MTRWAYLALVGQTFALLHLADLQAPAAATLSLVASVLLTTRYLVTHTKKGHQS